MTILKLQSDIKKLKRKLNSRRYRVYSAIISQAGTAAPTAVELENEIGSIVWTRNNVGIYFATLSAAFPENKTFIITNNRTQSGNYLVSFRSSDNQVNVVQVGADGTTPADVLSDIPIEIRVYP